MKLKESIGYQIVEDWMSRKKFVPFDFQSRTWQKIARGYNGMVVAPTGFGKTFSVFLGVLIDYMNHPKRYKKGVKLIWISPLRSLAKDLQKAMQTAVDEIGLDWEVAVRNGDTPSKIRRAQERSMPDVLLTTPETMHLMFSQKNNSKWFKHLQFIAVDEWHDLLSTKRGVLTELAIMYLKLCSPSTKVWGITATIGNIDQALEVLVFDKECKKVVVKSKQKKKLDIISILPDEVETLPWAGHLGGKLIDKVIPILYENTTTLIFTNTRNQAETWYQLLLDHEPDFAGQIAIHHGSIDVELRNWIEDAINQKLLKAVICTSSLDLGVDFKPVDCIIQVGSAKGVARFMQRAGRSGHSPHEVSKIYVLPTHSLQLIEVAALKEAVKQSQVEARIPKVMTFDVLVQFLVTLAVGEGFNRERIYKRVKNTYAFQYINEEEFSWIMLFITQGGESLSAYEDFRKVFYDHVTQRYKVEDRRISMRHRMNIGSIVSDAMLKVKFMSGRYIGMVEEYFISKLKPNTPFILAGKVLELITIKDMTVIVRRSKAKKAITPSWKGGRLPLTSYLSYFLRLKLSNSLQPSSREKELKFLNPLFSTQHINSHIPREDEFLVEKVNSKDGYHIFFYPFEGRLVHEVMASLFAYRIGKLKPMTFTMAMNDYGFELLSDQEIPVNERNLHEILSTDDLMEDTISSVNTSEMAKRKFRDIAVIAGLVVQSLPGKQKTNKSLQSSAAIFFKTFEEYEPDNLLLRQAYTEVFNEQIEERRFREAMERINSSTLVLQKAKGFTPLSFPIKVDSLRDTVSFEKLEDRIERLQKQNKKLLQ